MGAHAICDETKCKIPVYAKTETYTKTEVNNLINGVKGSIDDLNIEVTTFGAHQDLLHNNIDETLESLQATVNSLQPNINSLQTLVNSLTTRITALEVKVGG